MGDDIDQYLSTLRAIIKGRRNYYDYTPMDRPDDPATLYFDPHLSVLLAKYHRQRTMSNLRDLHQYFHRLAREYLEACSNQW